MAATKIWTLYNSVTAANDYAKNEKKTVEVRFDECDDRVNVKSGSEEIILGDIAHALNYISQDHKTHAREYVTGINVSATDCNNEMQATKEYFGKTDGALGYHCIQSFAPGEIDPEQAHAIGCETAAALWGDAGYQVLICTHLDREHIHNHFVINSVNTFTGEKDPVRYHNKIKAVSDRIVIEHGLSVIDAPGKNPAVLPRLSKRQRDTQLVVDEAISKATDLLGFLTLMEQKGYTINAAAGKSYWTVKHESWKRPMRLIRLGEEYRNAAILDRIANEYPKAIVMTPKAMYKAEDRLFRINNNWKYTYQYKYFIHMYRMGYDLRKYRPKNNQLTWDERRELDDKWKTLRRISWLTENKISTQSELESREVINRHKNEYLIQQKEHIVKQIRSLNRKNLDYAEEQKLLDRINIELEELKEELQIIKDIEENSIESSDREISYDEEIQHEEDL